MVTFFVRLVRWWFEMGVYVGGNVGCGISYIGIVGRI